MTDNKLIQEQLVRAFKSWEQTKFLGQVEKDEYYRLLKLTASNIPSSTVAPSCSTDDEGCLTCGS